MVELTPVSADADAGSSYLTTSQARTLGAGLPVDGMIALLALDDLALGNLLALASLDLDAAMRYQGSRYDPTQTLEFPRLAYGVSLPDRGIGADVLIPFDPYGLSQDAVVWDWDATYAQAVVPPTVQMACLLQAAWGLTSGGKAAVKRLEAIKSGLTGQAIGTANETYAASGLMMGLCDRAARLMEKYRLRSGRLL